jgi:hypothetical protein
MYLCPSCDHIKKLLHKPEESAKISCEMCWNETGVTVYMDRYTATEFQYMQDDLPNHEKIHRKEVEWR